MKIAKYKGDLRIGDIVISCAVLDDGTRIVSENGLTENLGTSGGRTYKLREKMESDLGIGPIPIFLASKVLEPFISEVFDEKDLIPISYDDNGKVKTGYAANIITKVCKVWRMALDAEVLQESQIPKAKKAIILQEGFAELGLTALVDEATGYQDEREKDALQKILDKFLVDNAHKWVKTFPDKFWIYLIKTKGYPSYMALKRPSFVGHWVNDIIYSRLAPAIKDKLNEINPRQETGSRKHKHHQFLTDEHGVPELKEHLTSVMALMTASKFNEDLFYQLLDNAYPKFNDNLSLNLEM